VAEGEYRKVEQAGSGPEEIRQLARAFNTMVERVDTRTAELAASRESAEKSLTDYLEVLTFIAHELKSPVAGSLTTLDLIEQGLVGEVPDKMRPRLAALRRYLTRGLELALEFNHLSRLETPGFALQKLATTDVRTGLVDVVVEDLAEDARNKGTKVTVEGEGAAQMDARLLRIVLTNLLGNAVKYGEDDGEVRVEITSTKDRLRVGVWNRGVGVPDEQRELLYAKFHRVRDPKLKGRKGSGVGLYLSRRIVELHGGSVGVEGEYGSWVRFWFELPLQAA
jgi:signal transduction histidine kinase